MDGFADKGLNMTNARIEGFIPSPFLLSAKFRKVALCVTGG
jgi:hypothetical protein